MNELNRLYEAMLRSWGTHVKDSGALMLMVDNNELPITLETMQIYLPLNNLLEENTVGKVFFHPACESIMSKETEIFKIIRKISAMTLMVLFKKYFTVLNTVSKKKNKKNLPTNVVETLEPFKSASTAEVEEVNSLFKKMLVVNEEGSQQDNRFIYFNITKGGKSELTGERVYYKTRPTFPFYNELSRRLNRAEDSPDTARFEIAGVSITKRSLSIAVHLFRSVFPGIDNPDSYEAEYTRGDAARLCSYCYSFAMVAEEMNKTQNYFREEFDKMGVYCIDLGWVARLDDISDIFRQVPPMQYNSQNTKAESDNSVDNNLQNVLNTTINTSNNQSTTTQQPSTQNMAGSADQIIFQNGQEYNVKIPHIALDESYQGYVIDPSTGNILHKATNGMGQLVIYRCSKYGNLLSKEGGMQPVYNMAQPQMQYVQTMPQQPQVVYMAHPNMITPQMQGMHVNSIGAVPVTMGDAPMHYN